MKTLITFVFLSTLLACNNSGRSETTKDSKNTTINSDKPANNDTSSYERMPNSYDTTQH